MDVFLEVGKTYLHVERGECIRILADHGDQYEVSIDEHSIRTMGKLETSDKIRKGKITLIKEDER